VTCSVSQLIVLVRLFAAFDLPGGEGSFGVPVLQQPRLPDIGWVSPNQEHNSLQSFGVLVLQQPGFHEPFQDRVNLLFCSLLGATLHNLIFADLVLQQPRFSDAGRASSNHQETHALQSLGDLVLQQPRFLLESAASPHRHSVLHVFIDAEQALRCMCSLAAFLCFRALPPLTPALHRRCVR